MANSFKFSDILSGDLTSLKPRSTDSKPAAPKADPKSTPKVDTKTAVKPEGASDDDWKAFLAECEKKRKAEAEKAAKEKAAAEAAAKKRAEIAARDKAAAEAAARKAAAIGGAKQKLQELVELADENEDFAEYFINVCKIVAERAGKKYGYFFDNEGKLSPITTDNGAFEELKDLGLILFYEVDDKGHPVGDPIAE